MKSKGFTIMELLVAIAIIGLLASVVLVSVNESRGNARDAKRISDLHDLRIAIEMYANENNGQYPLNKNLGAWIGDEITDAASTGNRYRELHGISPSGGGLRKYMNKIPTDPKWKNGINHADVGAHGYAYHNKWQCDVDGGGNPINYVVLLEKTMESKSNYNYEEECPNDNNANTWFHIANITNPKNVRAHIILLARSPY